MSSHASMNRSFALVWNEEQQAYVPAPEGSRRKGKRGGATVIAAAVAMLFASGAAHALDPGALPTGGQVVQGQASLVQTGSTLQVNQATDRAAINWQSFNIGSGAKVDFLQPSATSIALNRVLGQDPTHIFGQLNANGQVFLVNPSGVLFAPGAQVSAAGILASTRDISLSDFAASNFKFSGSGAGAVVNQGDIRAQQGGYVALLGAQVTNTGSITAPGGDVRLAAADQVTVQLAGNGLTGLTVEKGTLAAIAANSGSISASGGRIYLTADAADALAKAVVNNDGILEASGLTNDGGVIRLQGTGARSEVHVGALVDVSSASGKGGQVIATAQDVSIEEGARIDAHGATVGGEVLVGGGWQGKDARVENASTVVMKRDTSIDVSGSGLLGSGGTAVLWSQNYTGFFGSIDANAAGAGNGGAVETSSHGVLNVAGLANAQSTTGASGYWLLDPSNVTIAASGASGTAYFTAYAPTVDSTILASSIVISLYGSNGTDGTNVSITTGGTGSSAGNITVAADVASTHSGTPRTLTLAAANDINVNAAITSPNGALNVVLRPDSDASGVGSVNFGSGGRVMTNGGNFYVGNTVSTSTSDTVTKQGANFTMAAGSVVDVSGTAYGGNVDIEVNGIVTLAGTSLRDTSGTTPHFNLNGAGATFVPSVKIGATSILSVNTDPTFEDLTTQASVGFTAGTIGSAINAVKISGGAAQANAALTVTNTTGNSYVSEIGSLAFGAVSVIVGNGSGTTQSVSIKTPNASTDEQILVKQNGAGNVFLNPGDVKTSGVSADSSIASARPTSVSITTPTIFYTDGSVDAGTASFAATATGHYSGSSPSNLAEITAGSVALNGATIGDPALGGAVRVASTGQGSLSVTNSGASGTSMVRAIETGTSFFSAVSLTSSSAAGAQDVLFSNGDHVDTTNVSVPQISGGASDGVTFGVTKGVDLTRTLRSFTLTTMGGNIVLADNAVDMNAGAFTATAAAGSNASIAAQSTYVSAASSVPQIAAGDVTFNITDAGAVGTIGQGGKDIVIAKGATAGLTDKLTINTQQGSVKIHEATTNDFKTINLTLGGANAAQTIAVDLAGSDDLNIHDTGTGPLHLSAAAVNVVNNNRNFSLTTPSRSIMVDGQAYGSGSYSLNSGSVLSLGAGIFTYGGDINLFGALGINLTSSSTTINSDGTPSYNGPAGNITLNTLPGYSISSTALSPSLLVYAYTTAGPGGNITVPTNIDGRAGNFFSSVEFQAGGSTTANAGSVIFGTAGAAANYLTKGYFYATGKEVLNGTTMLFDTEQGNTRSGGAISIGGSNIQSNLTGLLTLDTSSLFAGGTGGSAQVYTQQISGVGFSTPGLTINAAGATPGSLTLQGVNTSVGGAAAYIRLTGDKIQLIGDLQTQGANVVMSGAPVIFRNTLIDTNLSNAGNSGIVQVNGSYLGAVATYNLTVDTRTSSGQAGAVILPDITNAGGSYINTLSINTSGTTANGSIALQSVATLGTQTYVGGQGSFVNSLSTSGGNVDISGLSSFLATTSSGTTGFGITTDRTGGASAGGKFIGGTVGINGQAGVAPGLDFTIDTTADGGGAAGALTVGSIGNQAFNNFGTTTLKGGTIAVHDVTAQSKLLIEANGAAADVNVASSLTTLGANSTIVVDAPRNFFSGGSINVPSTGNFYIYSTSPAATVENTTTYGKHYNQTYTSGAMPSYAGPGTGSWFFYSIAPVITVSATLPSITYGQADPSGTLTAANFSGFIDGDTLGTRFSGTQTMTVAAPSGVSAGGYRPVGTYAYSLNGSLQNDLGYQYAPFTGSLTVTPKAVTLTPGTTVASRAYDGTTLGNLSVVGPLIGAASGDAVALSGQTVTFASKNAGTGIAVTTQLVLGGSDASNYSIAQLSGLTATITPKALSGDGLAANAKSYDGTTNVSFSSYGTLVGLVGSETLNRGMTFAFTDANAGTGKTVNVDYTLGNGGNGGLASNYTIARQTTTATIYQKTLTIAGSTAGDKVYDGTTTTSVNAGTLTGLVGAETLLVSGVGTFSDKNVGSNKAVGVTYSLANGSNGGQAFNYTLASTGSLTANVTPKYLTETGAAVLDKIYDGGLGANLTSAGTLVGLASGESLTVSASASFADKNAGSNKAVSLNYSLADGGNGGLASNYTIAPQLAQATITPRAASAIAIVNDRSYDGTTIATASIYNGNGIIPGDQISFSSSGQFADKNVGSNKAVFVTYSVGGADAQNYSFSGNASTSASIYQKGLSVTGSTVTARNYDGTTAAGSLTVGTVTGYVGAETLSIAGSGTYFNKDVGANLSVQTSFQAADGTNGGLASNYVVFPDYTVYGTILPRPVAVSVATAAKVYDGTTTAASTFGLNNVLPGESVSISGATAFNSKNVNPNQGVSATGLTLGGSDSSNYQIGLVAVASAAITPKTLTVAGSAAADKQYDASTLAQVSVGTLSGLVLGETINAAATGAFSDKNVGSGTSVAVNYSLSNGLGGGLAANYVLAGETLHASITPAVLGVVGTSVADRPYDGTTIASVTAGTLVGTVGGESLGLSAFGSFTDKNAGTNKVVGVSYGLTDGGNGGLVSNYVLGITPQVVATITPKPVTLAGSTVADKVYDRSAAATVTAGAVVGLVGNETLGVSGSGTFSDANAGTAKSVATSYTLVDGTNGGMSGNYQVSGETLQASILQRAATVVATAADRPYDGSTLASATLSGVGILTGDTVGFTGAATFSDKNAGLAKTVDVVGIGSTDSAAANYTFNTTASTTASITPKAVTFAGTSAATREYDGTTGATVAVGSVVGLVGNETIATSATGTFSDKAAGTHKSVAVQYTVADGTNGGLAGNYAVTDETVQGVITPKSVAIDVAASNKFYDGTTSVVAGLSSGGIIAGDSVSFGGVATFMTKDAGVGKTVNVTGITATGADAFNYAPASMASGTADIAPKPLSISGSNAGNKSYDGTTTAIVSAGSLSGLVGSETLSVSAMGDFATKNAAQAKSVAVTYALGDGTDGQGGLAANYSLAGGTLVADVTPKAITVIAHPADKVYDGSVIVSATLAGVGIVAGDNVAITGNSTTADKNVGSGKLVTVDGVTLSGADASNYVATATATAASTVDITPRTVAVDATGVDRVYNGSAAAVASLSSLDLVAGDQVGLAGTATFGDKNAAANKPVSVSGIAMTGADAGNYQLASTTASTTASILPRAIQLVATGGSKVYDGGLDVTVSVASAGIVAGDQISLSGSGQLLDKNAGFAKAVSVTAVSIDGADAANYSLPGGALSTTATVTPRAASVLLVGPVMAVQGGSTTVALSPGQYAYSGVLPTEAIELFGTGTFADSSVGTGKTVRTTVALGDYQAGAGTSLGNYDLFTGPLSAAVGTITAATVVTPPPVTTAPVAPTAVPPALGAAAAGYQAALASLPAGSNGGSAGPVLFTTAASEGQMSAQAAQTADFAAAQRANFARRNAQLSDAADQSKTGSGSDNARRNVTLIDGGIRLPAGVTAE